MMSGSFVKSKDFCHSRFRWARYYQRLGSRCTVSKHYLGTTNLIPSQLTLGNWQFHFNTKPHFRNPPFKDFNGGPISVDRCIPENLFFSEILLYIFTAYHIAKAMARKVR